MLNHNHSERTQQSISGALSIHGWRHLDAMLLAALATEKPLLLIGAHGTAKTLLVERISETLDLTFRHYNASLLNYDDLVGIPLPEDGNDALHFVATPGSIWDAEFVFFDEISRCRPDLQNKLFPIIHERRVVGMKLDKLRFRWAAMNPPSPDDPDLDKPDEQYYLGSEPLDPALTDRFPFIIPVPTWGELEREDRRLLISWRERDKIDRLTGAVLGGMVERCVELIPQVEEDYGDWITDYIICTVDLLEKAKLPQSPRRARMLAEALAAIHAARIVLEGDEAELDESAEICLMHALPQNATPNPPTPTSIMAVHKQAWEISARMEDETWRRIFEENDHVKRVLVAEELELEDEEMSRLITQALNVYESEARKISLATAMYLAFRKHRRLNPAAWEPLVKLAATVLKPRMATASIPGNGPDMRTWTEIRDWAVSHRGSGELAALEINFILGNFPQVWRRHSWKEALEDFRQDLELFGVKELV